MIRDLLYTLAAAALTKLAQPRPSYEMTQGRYKLPKPEVSWPGQDTPEGPPRVERDRERRLRKTNPQAARALDESQWKRQYEGGYGSTHYRRRPSGTFRELGVRNALEQYNKQAPSKGVRPIEPPPEWGQERLTQRWGRPAPEGTPKEEAGFSAAIFGPKARPAPETIMQHWMPPPAEVTRRPSPPHWLAGKLPSPAVPGTPGIAFGMQQGILGGFGGEEVPLRNPASKAPYSDVVPPGSTAGQLRKELREEQSGLMRLLTGPSGREQELERALSRRRAQQPKLEQRQPLPSQNPLQPISPSVPVGETERGG